MQESVYRVRCNTVVGDCWCARPKITKNRRMVLRETINLYDISVVS
jgi:hypothetical protein